jgi:hypothetical protein
MTNLLKQAINTDDGDCAAKLIQNALGIESDEVANYCFLKTCPRIVINGQGSLAIGWERKCGIWPDMQFSQFFEFAIVVVVVGSLIVLATAVWSANRGRWWHRYVGGHSCNTLVRCLACVKILLGKPAVSPAAKGYASPSN